MSGGGDVKISDDFTAPLIIDNLPVQAVNMYVDVETRKGPSLAFALTTGRPTTTTMLSSTGAPQDSPPRSGGGKRRKPGKRHPNQHHLLLDN